MDAAVTGWPCLQISGFRRHACPARKKQGPCPTRSIETDSQQQIRTRFLDKALVQIHQDMETYMYGDLYAHFAELQVGEQVACLFGNLEDRDSVLKCFVANSLDLNAPLLAIMETNRGTAVEMAQFHESVSAPSIGNDILHLISDNAIIHKNGRFAPETLAVRMRQLFEQLQGAGHRTLRLVIDMAWLLGPDRNPRAWLSFVANHLETELAVSGLWLYDRNAFDADGLLDQVNCVPYVIEDTTWLSNPCYTPASFYLAAGSGKRLQCVLDTGNALR